MELPVDAARRDDGNLFGEVHEAFQNAGRAAERAKQRAAGLRRP